MKNLFEYTLNIYNRDLNTNNEILVNTFTSTEADAVLINYSTFERSFYDYKNKLDFNIVKAKKNITVYDNTTTITGMIYFKPLESLQKQVIYTYTFKITRMYLQ